MQLTTADLMKMRDRVMKTMKTTIDMKETRAYKHQIFEIVCQNRFQSFDWQEKSQIALYSCILSLLLWFTRWVFSLAEYLLMLLIKKSFYSLIHLVFSTVVQVFEVSAISLDWKHLYQNHENSREKFFTNFHLERFSHSCWKSLKDGLLLLILKELDRCQ